MREASTGPSDGVSGDSTLDGPDLRDRGPFCFRKKTRPRFGGRSNPGKKRRLLFFVRRSAGRATARPRKTGRAGRCRRGGRRGLLAVEPRGIRSARGLLRGGLLRAGLLAALLGRAALGAL